MSYVSTHGYTWDRLRSPVPIESPARTVQRACLSQCPCVEADLASVSRRGDVGGDPARFGGTLLFRSGKRFIVSFARLKGKSLASWNDPFFRRGPRNPYFAEGALALANLPVHQQTHRASINVARPLAWKHCLLAWLSGV